MIVSRWKYLGRFAPLFLMMMLLLSGCSGALDPEGPVAREQLGVIKLSFFIMIGVLIIVFAIFIYVILRFRQRKGQTGIPKQIEGNHKLEILWTVIPFILLLILAVPTIMYTFKYAHDYTKDKNAIHVKVTAHQFWWEFEYPDLGIKTAQDLVIPAGKYVSLELKSADLNHAFWIPQLAGKQDNNPGSKNINKMYIKADKAGKVYKGKCAELCGASHALMDFKVVTKTQGDFDAWADQLKAPVTVSADAAAGEQIFKAKCMTCHANDSNNASPAAPNLDGFANRERIAGFREHTDEWIRKWLKNPDAVKPGNNMPNLHLTDDEIDNLVKYLDELK